MTQKATAFSQFSQTFVLLSLPPPPPTQPPERYESDPPLKIQTLLIQSLFKLIEQDFVGRLVGL
jgi:hypothetical protein